MKRPLLRVAPTVVLATLAAAGVLLYSSLDTSLTVRVYLLFVGAVVLLALVTATGLAAREEGSEFERALAPRRRRSVRPEELERLERQVTLSVESAFDFHYRLRPALVAAADAALWRSHGLALDRGSAHLSPALWDVVRPDRDPPAERMAPGPSLVEIGALLDEIARIRR